jgi:dTDP-4-amino-4,6-dideoxygalactose transaminase
LENLIDRSVSAVVVTHLFGNPANLFEIQSICDHYAIPLIEDCAQAVGGDIDGKKLGSFGLISTFSFYPTKNLGAIGDAGAICTNNDEIAERIRKLAQYGWGDQKYEIEISGGVNSRLDEIQAMVLNYRFKNLDNHNKRRKEIVKRYTKSLDGKKTSILTKFENGGACHLAVVLIGENMDRLKIKSKLAELNIETALHYPFLDEAQIGLKNIITQNYSLTNSRKLANNLLTLPCFAGMTNLEIDYVCSTLENYFE